MGMGSMAWLCSASAVLIHYLYLLECQSSGVWACTDKIFIAFGLDGFGNEQIFILAALAAGPGSWLPRLKAHNARQAVIVGGAGLCSNSGGWLNMA
jgi:hypothetical protein